MARDKQIERTFVEFGANVDPLLKGIDNCVKAMTDADAKLNQYGRKLSGTFENALNPTDKLAKQLSALMSTGTSAAEVLKVNFDKINAAVESTKRHGETPHPLIAQLHQLGQMTQTSSSHLEQLGHKMSEFVANPMEAAKSSVTSLIGLLGPLASGWAAVGAAVIGAGAAVAKMDEHLSDEVIELRNHAMATGHTVQEYQSLNRIGKELGVNTDMLARQFGMLERQMATGTKMDFVKVLNALRYAAGETEADLGKGLISVLDDLGKRIAQVTDKHQKAELMNAAFNRRLMDTGVIVLLTKGHLEDYVKEVEHQIGFTDKYVDDMIKTHNAIAMVGRAYEGAKNKAAEFFNFFQRYVHPTTGLMLDWLARQSPNIPKAPGEARGHGASGSWGEEGNALSAEALRVQKEMEEQAKLIKEGILDTTEAQKALQIANEKYMEAFKRGQLEEAEAWKQKRDMFAGFEGALLSGMRAQAHAAEEYQRAEARGNVQGELFWAQEYQRISKAINAIKEAPKEFEKYVNETIKATERIQHEITVTGQKALGGNLDVFRAAESKQITDWVKRALQDQDSIQRTMIRDVTRGKLEELRIEQQITQQIIPRNEYEREQIELIKVSLDWEVRTEEIRVKFAGRRAELEEKIARLRSAPIVGPVLAGIESAKLKGLDQQMNEEINDLLRLRSASILRVHTEEYKRMIDAYKEYAGQLFDVILSSGKKGFIGILDWLKNDFKSMFRKIFENVFADLMQTSGLYQWFRKILAGTEPMGGATTTAMTMSPPAFGSLITDAVYRGTRDANMENARNQNYAFNPATSQWTPEGYGVWEVGQELPGLGALNIPGLYGYGNQGLAQMMGAIPLGGLGQFGGTASGAMGSSKFMSWLSSTLPSWVMGSLPFVGPAALGATKGGGLLTNLGMGLGGTFLAGGMSALGTGTLTGGWLGEGVSGFLGGGLKGIMTMFSNPWTAIPAIAAILVPQIIKWAKGPTTQEAGSKESFRDLKVNIGKDAFSQFVGQFMDVQNAWGIRKDLMMSPKFLVDVAAPAARAQGTFDKFLSSLEKVQTAWGTFDFRQAFEIGEATGNWEQLDKVFVDAFEHSSELQKMLPDWKDILTETGDAIKRLAGQFEDLWTQFQTSGEFTQEFTSFLEENSEALLDVAASSEILADQLDAAYAAMEKFKELQPMIEGFQSILDSLPNMIVPTNSIYQTFLDTGEIVPELAAQIEEFGGDLAAFEELSRLAKINAQFTELVEHFKSTGEVLPELRSLIQQFGGDLSVLDAAADLPQLMQGLQGIKDLVAGISGLKKTTIQSVLAGEWSPEVEAALTKMGLDPAKLQGISSLIKAEKGWDQAISEFQTKMKYEWNSAYNKWVQTPVGLEPGGILQTALEKYGGSAGATAISNYAAGFNTITPSLLATTKSAMDIAYENEITSSLDYLGRAQADLQDKVTALTTSVLNEIGIASGEIAAAVSAAKDDVVTQLKLIVSALNNIVLDAANVVIQETPSTQTRTATNPTYPTNEEGVPIQQPVLPRGGYTSVGGAPMVVVIEGPIYGFDDFQAHVEEAVITLRRRVSPAFSTS